MSAQRETVAIERTVLGALLVDNTKLAAWGLRTDDFGHPFHRHVFDLIESQSQTGGASVVTIAPLMVDETPVDDIEAAEYVRRLPACVEDATPGIHRILREHAARRALVEIATNLKAAALDYRTPLAGVSAAAIDQINTAAAATHVKETRFTFAAAADAVIAEMDNPIVDRKITTGLTDLDRKLAGGLRRGQNILIAGRTGMGKSMAQESMLLRTARAGHGVMLFSLEMQATEILERCLCDIAFTANNPITYDRLSAGLLSEHEKRRIRDARDLWRGTPMVIDEAPGLTIAEIAARARAQKLAWEADGRSLDVVGIDHLLLVKPSGRYAGKRVQEIDEISAGLMQLAKDLDVAVVSAQQLNRQTESRENKRPQLNDLRDSGSLEQDAHVVIMAYREAYYLERMPCSKVEDEEARIDRLSEVENRIELIVAKQRRGPPGVIECYCHAGANVIRDLDKYRGRS